MDLKILCTQWGHEHLSVEDFFSKVKAAGYDGVDTWMPEDKAARKIFIDLLKQYDLSIVSQQHQATGNSIKKFCNSFEYYLNVALECDPLLINSHSGRDYFTIDEQLAILDIAENFSAKNNIRIAHETHRGRMGFYPSNAYELFTKRPSTKITADFSHWVCVTESHLENFQSILEEAITRTEHVHARVGFIEGPQIPDPRKIHWQKEVDFFLSIWKRIYDYKKLSGAKLLTYTAEFGPPPYLWTDVETNHPVSDQWDINVYIKDLLKSKMPNE